MKIGGIICVKDQNIHRLINHLVSIGSQIADPFSYVLVDYGSSEPYRVKVREIATWFGIELIEVDRDVTPWRHGRAFNIGIKHLRGCDVIFTTGADLVYEAGFLQAAFDLWEENAVVTAPLVRVRQDGALLVSDGPYYGTLTLAGKDRWFKLRGYDEDFTHWGREDTDLIERMLRTGMRKKHTTVYAWHQFHPTRENLEASARNTKMYYDRAGRIERNPGGWGEL